MPIYELLPTMTLSEENQLVTPKELPELVHYDDPAKSVFIDFSRMVPSTIPPDTLIDDAINEMRIRHTTILLISHNKGKIVGVISLEDALSDKPLRLMHEKSMHRSEITVDMVMKPRQQIYVIESPSLKNAKVGHVLNTIKEHSIQYILVIKKTKSNKHVIHGLFSASQIGKQLHIELSSLLAKEPETIVELHKERKV